MEIKINQNKNPKQEQINSLINEIEQNLDQMKKIIPEEIKEETSTLINQFISIINDQEKLFIEQLDILNKIINELSQKIKNSENINEETKKCLSKIKKLMYQINTIESRPTIITKSYHNGKYKGDYLNGQREGKGIYI